MADTLRFVANINLFNAVALLLCMVEDVRQMPVDFKRAHFHNGVIVHVVFFCVRHSVSYRELQEILAEHGIIVGYATLDRWIIRYSHQIATQICFQKGHRSQPRCKEGCHRQELSQLGRPAAANAILKFTRIGRVMKSARSSISTVASNRITASSGVYKPMTGFKTSHSASVSLVEIAV
ncbi:IS6 family transposase [Brucella tritici]|uniref:IS6 family transposase n=1 Tax=Brucella tritici TaxID=94626 RepID=UPI0015908743|nr:IS6 family transposase [Brucella tritici]